MTTVDYGQKRRAALMITHESLVDFKKHLGYSKSCMTLDLSGIQNGSTEDDDMHTDLANLSDRIDSAQCEPVNSERSKALASLPPVSPRTPKHQRTQLSRLAEKVPSDISSRDEQLSGDASPFKMRSPKESVLELHQLLFNADEHFPIVKLDESFMYYDETENIPPDASVNVEQLCSQLENMCIISNDISVTENRKENEMVPTIVEKKSSATIAPFYHPGGKPISLEDNSNALKRAFEIFDNNGNEVMFTKMVDICNAINIPVYWKRPIFNNCVSSPQQETITSQSFAQFWNRMTAIAHDDAARFVFTLTNGMRTYVEFTDFAPLVMDVVETHQSLDFLKSDPRFHNAYVETVTCRIFWAVNRSWSGRITATELRRSNFLEVLRNLDTVKDVSEVLDYFNYEHFYVVYCKFQNLASGQEYLTADQFANYSEGALSDLVVSRIFSGAVLRDAHSKEANEHSNEISYKDFVYFLLAEVDKSNPASIEYWFRVMDLNGDGRLSIDEMHQFFDGVTAKMNAANVDTMSFNDIICLLWDAIRPRSETFITLSDIKRSQMSSYFFNTFINWFKHFVQEAYEGNDRAEGKQRGMSDWDLYCENEHDLLTADNGEDVDEFDGDFNDEMLEVHDEAFEYATMLGDDDVPSSE